MTEAPQTICRLVVRGHVQGVGYRAWAEEEARARGIEGWLGNRRDGTVDAVFAGAAAVVGAMIEACWDGPPAEHDDSIDKKEGSASDLALRQPGELFSVLPTK